MTRDPLSVEELTWTLWALLICQCDRCSTLLTFDEFDATWDRDPYEWAQQVAPVVKAAGWSTPDYFELLCPKCTAQDVATD